MSKKKKIEMERKQLEEMRKKKRQGKGSVKGKEKDKKGKKRKGKGKVEEEEEEEEEPSKLEEKEPEKEPEVDKEEDGDGEGEAEHKEGEGEEEQPLEPEEVDPFAYQEIQEDDIKFKIQNQKYYFDYDISCNTRLSDYFNSARRGLRSLIVCGKITETVYICPKAISTYDTLNSLSSIFPIYSHILESGNLQINKMRDKDLRKILSNITTLGVGYDDLAYHTAKGLTISRRNVLTTMSALSSEQINKIGPAVVKNLRKNGLDDHQILGLVDSKYAEAAYIRLIHDGTFNFSNKMRVIFFKF